MRSGHRILALATVLAAAATPAFGQVTIGTAGPHESCFPFNCYGPIGGVEYQQVYAASQFAGPMLINSIQFFDSQFTGALFSGNIFTISFSESSVTPDDITNDYASNIGLNSAVFYNDVLSGDATAPIFGTPYAYDPSLGNLLMDVVLSGDNTDNQGALDAGCDYFTGDANDGVVRDACAIGGLDPGYGLVTEFNGNATVTPEPVTMVLLGTGLLGIGGVGFRRKKRPVD